METAAGGGRLKGRCGTICGEGLMRFSAGWDIATAFKELLNNPQFNSSNGNLS
jgi:hypothetical protein